MKKLIIYVYMYILILDSSVKEGVSCAVLVYMYIQFESVLKWYCVICKGLGRGPKALG